MKERLQKLMAKAGLASRREAERMIADGRVEVNGRTAELGESADPGTDRIVVDGKPLMPAERKVSLLLNKPTGYVTTAKDPQGRKTVFDLLPQGGERLFSVGRLDLNSEGLLLLTNDGDLAFKLTHPRHKVLKTYLVRVRGLVSESEFARLRKGVRLEDGMTAPAQISGVRNTGRNTWFEIAIGEGRNRQVRRMCEAVGHPVIRLKRIRLDFLDLGTVPVGKYRPLTDAEIVRLKKLG